MKPYSQYVQKRNSIFETLPEEPASPAVNARCKSGLAEGKGMENPVKNSNANTNKEVLSWQNSTNAQKSKETEIN